MNTSVEERLHDYALRIDGAVDAYAERVRARSVATAFLEPPQPTRPRAGRRRLVAAVTACVVASAVAGVVIAQRDPSSPRRSAAPQPAPTTTLGLHTIDGKSFGPMPTFSGRMTASDYAEIPDYVSVAERDGLGIAGYVKKSDLYPVVDGHVLPGKAILPVYADTGSPLVGHFYQCRGFVPLGTDPDTIPCTGGGKTPTSVQIPPMTELDLTTGSAFGFAPGPLDPDTVRASVSVILGPPTRDTGWYVTKSIGSHDCLGGLTQRILRWGDLSYAFWRDTDPTLTTLWSWTLGGGRGEFDQREPAPIVETPTLHLTTSNGIGLGTTLAELQHAYGSNLYVPANGSVAQLFPTRAPSVLIGLTHGTVGTIEGRLVFC